jgi:hypothetical protein
MKRILRYLPITIIILLPAAAKAQFEGFKDSVVQLYGVMMTADSLQAVPAVSIMIQGQNRGTISNDDGVFSIVVLKGDVIQFSSIGFKPKTVMIPKNIAGNQYSIIQLMVTDTVYLAATIIKQRPSREQFERDFVNTQIPDDQLEIARKNNTAAKRQFIAANLPRDGQEAVRGYLNNQATSHSYTGQVPPQNIFNPLAWAEFIKSWKRGDFKNKTATPPPTDTY